MRCARCAVRGAQCTVCGAQCTVRDAQCAVCGVWCAVCGCAVHGARRALCAQCAVRSACARARARTRAG
eukprot:3368112-Alexandrium_andersonii.AAC.1